MLTHVYVYIYINNNNHLFILFIIQPKQQWNNFSHLKQKTAE